MSNRLNDIISRMDEEIASSNQQKAASAKKASDQEINELIHHLSKSASYEVAEESPETLAEKIAHCHAIHAAVAVIERLK